MVHFERIHERSGLHHYEIEPHIHDGLFQLLYIRSGGGQSFIDGRLWPVSPGTLIVVPSLAVHGFRFTPDIDGPVVTAAQRPLESLASVAAPELLATLRRPAVLAAAAVPRHAEALLPLFDAIERESRVQAPGQLAAGSALLMALFVQIARIEASLDADPAPCGPARAAGGRSRRAAQIERFRAQVDARFRQHASVADYAAELGISAGQLARLCRDALGMSPLDVINARLLHEAQRELIYSNLSIKQIAHLLGFADEAYFGRFFRKQSGQQPSAFRVQARGSLSA